MAGGIPRALDWSGKFRPGPPLRAGAAQVGYVAIFRARKQLARTRGLSSRQIRARVPIFVSRGRAEMATTRWMIGVVWGFIAQVSAQLVP